MAPAIPPLTRNPTITPTTIVTNVPHMINAVSAIDRPRSNAQRGTGSDRSRSNRPDSVSSATPTAAPANNPFTAASAGMRKSTYSTSPVWMAPPNTKRKISRNMIDVRAFTTSSCGVRMNCLIVRPA